MAVKIIDLQLLYGVAGAREKFEDLCSQLVKAEQPKADKVRVSRGDGGIDVHVGDLTSSDGIEVYQCKFFPQGLDESQKGQIRESFKTCRTSFKLKRWTLCLPLDLSKPEKTWFEKWRGDQAEHGVEITDPWGATKLESLLYQTKNQGFREVFFKEEHLAQIREMHMTLMQLIPDILARLQQDPQAEARAAEVEARGAAYLSELVKVQEQRYQTVTGASFPRPGHWQVVISPARIPEQPKLGTLAACWAAVESSRQMKIGRKYLVINENQRESGNDWTGSFDQYCGESDSWLMTQKGVFVHTFTIFDDIQPPPPFSERWHGRMPSSFTAGRFLDIDLAIWTVTEVFRFAGRLASIIVDNKQDSLQVAIKLTDTRNRVLTAREDPSRMQGWYIATVDQMENSWVCKREELQSTPDAFAARALVWFFERFNHPRVTDESMSRLQSGVYSER